MYYQIECVVTKIEFGEKVFLSFEPTSKYQLKINGYTNVRYRDVDAKWP